MFHEVSVWLEWTCNMNMMRLEKSVGCGGRTSPHSSLMTAATWKPPWQWNYAPCIIKFHFEASLHLILPFFSSSFLAIRVLSGISTIPPLCPPLHLTLIYSLICTDVCDFGFHSFHYFAVNVFNGKKHKKTTATTASSLKYFAKV